MEDTGKAQYYILRKTNDTLYMFGHLREPSTEEEAFNKAKEILLEPKTKSGTRVEGIESIVVVRAVGEVRLAQQPVEMIKY